MKLVAEVLFTKQMLDACLGVTDVRNSGTPRPSRPQIESVVADGEFS